MKFQSLAFCIGFCKKSVAVALLFSSLICSAWAEGASSDMSYKLAGAGDLFNFSINKNQMPIPRVGYPSFTIASSANPLVTPDNTFSQIIVASPTAQTTTPDIRFGTGTVTLTGESGLMWDTAIDTTNSTRNRDKTWIWPNGRGAANLILQAGEARGNIWLRPNSVSGAYYGANLLIGPGNDSETLTDVTLTGRIDGSARNQLLNNRAGYVLGVETQGGNLTINGAIGQGSASMIGYLNAHNGNIEVHPYPGITTGQTDFILTTYKASVMPGFHIETPNGTHNGIITYAVNISDNSYIKSGGSLDITDAIGDPDSVSGGGSMSKDALLEGDQFILLYQGIKKAAGTIKAGASILTHSFMDRPRIETALNPIDQGGADPLAIMANSDILAGPINTDTVKAKRDILTGSTTETYALADRIYLNSRGDGIYYPFYGVTANTLEADGRIMTGELNLPKDGESGQLVAGNIYIGKFESTLASTASSGNVTIDKGSITLNNPDLLSFLYTPSGKPEETRHLDYASQIDGSLTINQNTGSSFTTLKVGETTTIHSGTLTGTTLVTDIASFSDITKMDIADTLNVAKNLTAAGNGDATVTHTTVGEDASISDGTYKGDNFRARNAFFNNVKALTLNKLEASGDIIIGDNGAADIAALKADGKVEVNGGSYTGSSFTSGGNANFADTRTISISTANIGENLTSSNNANASFQSLTVAGGVEINGGMFRTGHMTTGTDSAKKGDFQASNAAYDLGRDSFVNGNLVASQSSGTFIDLTVNDVVQISGGYLDGNALNATSGVFKDNTTAYIDDLVLAGNAVSLEIEDGSYVIVQTISDSTGTELISTGGLIILGDPDDPDSWSELGDINLETGAFEAEKARVRVGDIYGKGQGTQADDIKTHQLMARNIDISNANIQLTGLRDFASKIDENLVISQNGVTTLGDISIGGLVDISGGSVQARRLVVGEDATFNSATLALLGTGANASNIGGSLIIRDNISSRLGDIAIKEDLIGDGGEISANTLNVGNNAVLNNLSLRLNTEESNHSLINGQLSITGNKDSSLGHLHVGGNMEVEGGDLTAQSLTADMDVKFSSVKTTLNGTNDNRGKIGGNLSITHNMGSNLGYLEVNGDMEADGGDLVADTLLIGQSLALNDISAILKGTADNPGSIKGNLDLEGKTTAQLGYLEVGDKTSAADNNITAERLTTGSANFTNARGEFKEISIQKEGIFNQGAFTASKMTGNDVTFQNGITAAIEEMIFAGDSKSFSAGNARDSIGNTYVSVGSLDLNGGNINVGNVQVAPALLAVKSFVHNASTHINGNIGVNLNGQLLLGTRDLGWLPPNLAEARAILAVAQPMTLGQGYGIHVTGAGLATPLANQIRFDSGSLFIIDGSTSRIYYMGNWIPTTRLRDGNGASGALSAQSPTITANVAPGAQIQILNPIPNTVIVALGQNIKTNYLASSTLSRNDFSAPWTGANLIYDNKSVKIERLEGAYAGQFSVKPVDTPDTPTTPVTPPDTPVTPVTPPDTPVTPTTPSNPANPPVVPDTPGTPATPAEPDTPPNTPGDTPVKPDTPNTPANPSTPDTPGTPSTPDTPAQPDTPPAKPDFPQEPDTQPNTPSSQPDTPATPVHPGQSSRPKPSQTHPNAHPAIHHVIHHALNNGNVGTESRHLVTNSGAGFLSYTLQHEKPIEATYLVEGSLRMLVLGAVPQLALAANNAGEQAMSQRLGLENMKSDWGDLHARSISLWAIPLYKTQYGWDMEAGSHDYDFHGGIGGIAIGGDITWENIVRAGISFNIGGGYAKSGGQLPETANNMNFWGLGAYMGFNYANLGIAADVNFTSSYNKLKQEISALPDWSELKADARAYALSSGLGLEYRIKTSVLNTFPHAGFKYHHLYVEDYDIRHKGSTIIKGASLNQNIWTFPVGIKFAKDWQIDNGWTIKPMFDFHVTPAAGDINAKTTTRFTGTNMDMDLSTQMMDYITYGAAFGLEASIGNCSFGVNYNIDAGSKSLGTAIFGNFRYEF